MAEWLEEVRRRVEAVAAHGLGTGEIIWRYGAPSRADVARLLACAEALERLVALQVDLDAMPDRGLAEWGAAWREAEAALRGESPV